MDEQNTGGYGSGTGGAGGTGGTGGSGYGGSTGGSGAGSANTPSFGSDLDAYGSSGTAGGTGSSTGGLGGSTSGLGGTTAGGAGGLGGSTGLGSTGTGSVGGSTGTGGSTGGGNPQVEQVAQGLENAAHKLDDFANQQGPGASGIKARAGAMASSVADTIESAAQYLRDSDVRNLQSNLERQVRDNPLQTLLIGVAAGWVLGKILR